MRNHRGRLAGDVEWDGWSRDDGSDHRPEAKTGVSVRVHGPTLRNKKITPASPTGPAGSGDSVR